MPTPTPTYRGNIEMPPEVAREVIQKMQDASAIMKLAQKVNLPGDGKKFPMITGDPEAAWVAETGMKPVSNPTLSSKTMIPYEIAVIVPFSEQFVRDRDVLYKAVVERIPGALAKVFDQTVAGAVDAPGENFDTFASATAQELVSDTATAYAALAAAYADIAENGGEMNGIAMAPSGKAILLQQTDTLGHPLFTPGVGSAGVYAPLGAPITTSRGIFVEGEAAEGTDAGTPDVVGIAGDWTKAFWGTVEGMKIKILDQATLKSGTDTTIYLAQQDMIAVRAKIEIGFVADTSVFNRLLGAIPTE